MSQLVPIIFTIDESIAVPYLGHEKESVSIYERKIIRNRERLFSKSTLAILTLSEHLAYFHGLTDGSEHHIFYLFDPALTTMGTLARVRNLALPQTKLIAFPGAKHRAINAFLLSYLINRLHTRLDKQTFISYQQVSSLLRKLQAWMITTDDQFFKPYTRQYKSGSLLKKGEKNLINKGRKFNLYQFDTQRKNYKRIKQGDPITLWNTLLAKRVQSQTVWVVEKGGVTLWNGAWELWKSSPFIHWITIDDSYLPEKTPFLHILFVPDAVDPNYKGEVGEVSNA